MVGINYCFLPCQTCSTIAPAVVDIASGKGVLKPVSAPGPFNSQAILVSGSHVFAGTRGGKVSVLDTTNGDTHTRQASGSVAALQLLSGQVDRKSTRLNSSH